MLKDKAGNRLFRKVTIKIVYPDNLFPEKTYSHHAGPHQGFGPDGVDDLLMQTATRLDELYPWWEFRVVELTSVGRTARFVFTYAGPRSVGLSETKGLSPSANEGSALAGGAGGQEGLPA